MDKSEGNFNTGDPDKLIKIKDTDAKSLSDTKIKLNTALMRIEDVMGTKDVLTITSVGVLPASDQLNVLNKRMLSDVKDAIVDGIKYLDHVEAVLAAIWCSTDRGQLECGYDALESEILRKA